MISEYISQLNMEEGSLRCKILRVLNSRAFMILLAVLIAFECLDIVAEIMVEQEIRETVMEDNTRIRNFVLKLKYSFRFSSETNKTINNVIISEDNILQVYNIHTKVRNGSCIQDNAPGMNNFSFLLNIKDNDTKVYYGTPSAIGYLDINTVSRRTDQILQDVGHGLRIFGLTNIIFMALETTLRIVCTGMIFLKNKIEVFDAFVVYTSFTLDCSFFSKEFESRSTVVLLLVPWRIIRIINSLISAVQNKQKLQIKSLKAEKKKLEEKQMKLRTILLDSKENQGKLTDLCKRKGATDAEVSSCLCQRKTHITLAAVSTMASMMLIGTRCPSVVQNVDQSVSPEDQNNNENKNKTDIIDQFHKRSVSTPNLVGRNASVSTSTPYVIPGIGFISPFSALTPVAVRTHQNIFFPDDFDYRAYQQKYSPKRCTSCNNHHIQKNAVPDIMVTEH